MIGTHPTGNGSIQSPLEMYLRQINDTPLLTVDEERELAYRIEDGDCEARDHLVRANLRLVVNIARNYQGKGLDLHDLIAEGNFGLLRAAEAFDASMNTRFSTYAVYWVKQSIRRALINSARTIRLPAYMMQMLTEWRKATNHLHEELGRPPTEEEVAEWMKLPPRKFPPHQKGDPHPQRHVAGRPGRRRHVRRHGGRRSHRDPGCDLDAH